MDAPSRIGLDGLVSGDCGAEFRETLGRLLAARAPGYVAGHASAWNVWDAFADFHGFDPEAPSDAQVVAFVHARVMAGVGFSSLSGALNTIRLGVEGTPSLREAGSLTVAAQRHLSNLHYEGWFSASAQSPLVSVGQIRGMIEQAPSPLHALLVSVTYLAGLRPSEWVPVQLEHTQVDARGVKMFLPSTKTGEWLKVAIEPLAGTPFDPVVLAESWLAVRGGEAGPFTVNSRGGGLSEAQVSTMLREAAAAAGVSLFTPYSLRRSLAVHMDLHGIEACEIQQRLRHSPNGQTYRRYVEPLLALMDRDGARRLYLDAAVPEVPSVPVTEVGRGVSAAPRFAFAGASLDALLVTLDLSQLRVPKGLVAMADSTIAEGRRVFGVWSRWCHKHGFSPADSPGPALTRWVVQRQGEVDPVTVESNLASLRVGFLDATGVEYPPGWDQAFLVARGGANAARAARAPRYLSRPATDDDRVRVCEAVLTAAPPVDWAVTCLAWASGASSSVEVLEVSIGTATVQVDGGTCLQLGRGDFGLLDPVLAAGVIGEGLVATVPATPTEEDVWATGAGHSEALRARLATVLVAGSGTRPSDIARARVDGLSEAPGGLVVMLRAVKGRRPSRIGRDRLLWAPHRDGAMDPVAAWEAWRSWHPKSESGALLVNDLSGDARKAMSASDAGALVGDAIRRSGVEPMTPYGFRYGRAQEMHDHGYSDETIAEALGHEDISTTRGYIQAFDPFSLLEEGEPKWAQ